MHRPEIETMPAESMRLLIGERLSRLSAYVYERSPVYKNKFDRAKVRPSDIGSVDDIECLPLTEKDELREHYPFGMFSENCADVSEFHVSSGTTGNPIVVGYTRNDLDLWADVMARSLAAAGARKGDKIQVAYGYGLFTGGLGLHYGALAMGLGIMPMSTGQTQRQVKLMEDFCPRVLACTPSYALYIAEEMRRMGKDPAKSTWEIGVFGAEPWSESMRAQIERALGMKAYDIYGLSEISGPGVAMECESQDGMHIWWDVFYPEVLDLKTGKPVKNGERGELVITTLTKEAIPLVRYRTRDIVRINYKPCVCGRTAPRISKVLGRTDDMLIIRGINIFPSQVEHVLLEIEEVVPHYFIIVYKDERGLDCLEVQVELLPELFSDEIKKMENLRQKIKSAIQAVLGISVKVTLVEPETIARFQGKAQRVIDKR